MGVMEDSDSTSPQETMSVETGEKQDMNESSMRETSEAAEQVDTYQNAVDILLVQNLSQTLEVLRELRDAVLQIQYSLSQILEQRGVQPEPHAARPPPVPSQLWSWKPKTVAEEVAETVLSEYDEDVASRVPYESAARVLLANHSH